MIPIHDDNPTRTVPFVTVTLIVLNVAVFLYEFSLPKQYAEAFIAAHGMIPDHITREPSAPIYATIFSSMFLHGGWLHLIGNMLYLWIFGNNIEDSVGHFKFIVFYLLAGIAASLTHVVVDPRSAIPAVGASGAISGVLGAYLLLFPRARVLTIIPLWIFIRSIYLPAWVLLLFWFGLQLFSGVASLGVGDQGGVAWWAHVGGFILGAVLVAGERAKLRRATA